MSEQIYEARVQKGEHVFIVRWTRPDLPVAHSAAIGLVGTNGFNYLDAMEMQRQMGVMFVPTLWPAIDPQKDPPNEHHA